MERFIPLKWWKVCVFLVGAMLFTGIASAQDEIASAIRRYKAYEASTGYYEQYEVLPSRQRPLVRTRGIREGLPAYGRAAARLRSRRHLRDAHQGLESYQGKTCESCHTGAARNIHSARGNLTCRQCHGADPIASIEHYWSPLNPIRRHAYVCAKCHEGASASYATYVIHEPFPALASTFASFPVLAYAFWIMVGIAVGTFALFLPHTAMWGIRELFVKKEKNTRESPDNHSD